MASIVAPTEFVVFKFESTGLAALCAEVAWLDEQGELTREGVDKTTARYRWDEPNRRHEIVFDYVKSKQ